MTNNDPAAILSIRAGHLALRHLQQHGLDPAAIGTLPGAAGGPKALGLTGLDQAVFSWLATAPRVRELVGASIGGWRMACAMQDDPTQAFARLAACYTETQFSMTDRSLVTQQTQAMLHQILSQQDLNQLLNHPHYRLSLLLTQTHGLLKHDAMLPLTGGLIAAVALNTLSRPLLRHLFTRVICHDPRSALHFMPQDPIPTVQCTLNASNLVAALMGSAAIPGVILASHLAELPNATLRDGGLSDYHLDLPFANANDLTLYPHFSERMVPGWFDKFLPWRHADAARQARTILIAPTRAYLEHLPQGKLPNRSDFKSFAGHDQQRRQYWRQATAESQRLGDAFCELVASGRIAAVARPLFDD